MINNKLRKLGYGIIVSGVLGVSGCYLDGQSYQETNYSSQNNMPTEQMATGKTSQPKQESHASKEPTQKSTPGPKQNAAPQIPVIQ